MAVTTAATCAAALNEYRAGNLPQAVRLLHTTLRQNPQHSAANHLMGSMALEQGELEVALDYLTRAVRHEPKRSDFRSRLARALLQAERLESALHQARQAVLLRPQSAGTHNLLGAILIAMGRYREAADSIQEAHRLAPKSIHILLNLAHALWQGRQLETAIACFQRALALGENTVAVHLALISLLSDVNRTEDALEHCRQALALDDQALPVYQHYANLLEGTQRLQEAMAVVVRGLELAPHDPVLHMIAARIERREGRLAAATERLERLVETGHLEEQGPPLHLELGQLKDLAGDYRQALGHFIEGNRLAAAEAESAETGVDKHNLLRRVEALRKHCNSDWVASCRPTSSPEVLDDPVFVIGFPRSGTTLLDQILDSHPAIQTLEERLALYPLRKKIEQLPGGYPAALGALSPTAVQDLRDTYFGVIDHHLERQPGRLLVDKFPLNLIDVPLIWRVFPQAKLLLAMRHPCDVCLSCFMQYFRLNDAMANFLSLEDTAHLYIQVMELWQQYAACIPLQHYAVRYEDVVTSLAIEARRMLKFIGVPWDDAVMRYAEHAQQRGRIRTPSYHQVTQPIYQHAKFRWHHYADQIPDIVARLESLATAFGY